MAVLQISLTAMYTWSTADVNHYNRGSFGKLQLAVLLTSLSLNVGSRRLCLASSVHCVQVPRFEQQEVLLEWPLWEDMGLSCAGHSHSELALTDPAGQSWAHQWHWQCLCAVVFRKGLKTLHSSCERGVRTNCPADTQVREKEEGGGIAGAREDSPHSARADIHPHCSPLRTFSRNKVYQIEK